MMRREKPAKLFIIEHFQLLITFRLNVIFFYILLLIDFSKWLYFFSISNCKDCGKRRISSVNFAFTRMWTEYIANESNERERLVFVRLTKLRRSAQTKYERNGTQVLDAPNSQRCIVTSPRVSFQCSVTEVVVLRKFGRSFL